MSSVKRPSPVISRWSSTRRTGWPIPNLLIASLPSAPRRCRACIVPCGCILVRRREGDKPRGRAPGAASTRRAPLPDRRPATMMQAIEESMMSAPAVRTLSGSGADPAAAHGGAGGRPHRRPGAGLRARPRAAARARRHGLGLPPRRRRRPAGGRGRRQPEGRLRGRCPGRVPPQRLSVVLRPGRHRRRYFTRGRPQHPVPRPARVAFDENGFLEYCS